MAEQVADRNEINEALKESCGFIFKYLKVPLQLPLTMEDENCNLEDKLSLIAKLSQVRYQFIDFKDDWHVDIYGPLLCIKEQVSYPVALIPDRNKKYIIYDPVLKTVSKLTKEKAQGLKKNGYVFFKSLPKNNFSFCDFAEWMLNGFSFELVTIFCLVFIIGILNLAFPVISGLLFDYAMPAASFSFLRLFCISLLIAGLTIALFRISLTILIARIWSNAVNIFQIAIVDKLLQMPISFFYRFSSGELAYRALGVDYLSEIINERNIVSVILAAVSLFNIGLLFFYNFNLAVCACLLLLFYALSMSAIYYFFIRVLKKESSLAASMSSQVHESLGGITKLRVAGAENRFFERWANYLEGFVQVSAKAERFSNFINAFNWAFKFLAIAILFYVFASFNQSFLTVGQFVAFNIAFAALILSILFLAENAISFLKAFAFVNGLRPILLEAIENSEHKAEIGKLNGQIEFMHASFHYPFSSRQVLFDVSLQINSGEFVAIVGSSGSGKSTLVRLLLGFDLPKEGAVLYDGQDLSTLNAIEIRKQCGVVLQTSRLFPGSILDNIVASRLVSSHDIEEVLQLSGLHEMVGNLPMGLQTLVNDTMGLSGGQKQRILIARALVKKPKILIFDEATSALDNETQQIISHNIAKLKSTRIIIAHRLSAIKNADKIYVLDKGHLVQSGNFNELMSMPGIFADLAKRQLV